MGVRRITIALALTAPGLAVLIANAALAEPPKAPAVAPGSHAQPPATKKPGATDAGTPASSRPAPLSASSPGASPGSDTSSDGGVVEAKTLDGGTRVFKFSELDIEGRLKSPQLVYFLRRVRAEFAAGDLGHRSFMREMSETRKESSF
jgi:hypothetical protein